MSGHGSTAGLMAYGDANAVAMEIGEFEVLPGAGNPRHLRGTRIGSAPENLAPPSEGEGNGFFGDQQFPDALHRGRAFQTGAGGDGYGL